MAFADSQANARFYATNGAARVVLAGAVTKGDALGFSGGWKRALATAGGVIQARAVAGEDGNTGDTITVYIDSVEIDDRFSGATVGGAVYVAEGTSNGMYTQTAPSTSLDSTKIVGYALTATRLVIHPNLNVDSVA